MVPKKGVKFKKYVILGNVEHPAETTCSSKNIDDMTDVVRLFLPGGSMWRKGDKVHIMVWAPGQVVPDDVARHMV